MPDEQGRQHQLQPGDDGEAGAERLLARLVPKRRPPGISAGSSADEREGEEGGFADPPLAVFRELLVDPERGEGGEVYRDEGGGEVGGGDEGEHFGWVAWWGLRG